MNRLTTVAVIGSGEAPQSVLSLARETGRAIAKANCHLICGGRLGVMAAACRGHREARTPGSIVQTVGILPGLDPADANEYVDIVIPSGLGIARNAMVVSSARAVIAIAGGSGTLSELALAWQFGRPIAALALSGGWAYELAGRSVDGKRGGVIHSAETPQDAIEHLMGELGERS